MTDQKITQLTANTTPATTDLLPMVDDPSGTPATQKITISDLLKVIDGLTADTSPATGDEVVTYDITASGPKKVTLANLIKWGLISGTLSDQTDLQSELNARISYNYLINGGFDFAQRQVPGTLTTYATNTYSADRWRAYVENASYQYARQDGLGETGLTSQYFGAFKKITNTGKMFIYQILEGKNSVALRSKTVIFQCQMKASAAKTIRMGVFELQTAGTIDTVPSPIVTAAGANSTDPTMGTNVAIITAAQSKSVTTSMQTFSVSVTVPSNSKNLICAVWTDSQFAANDILYIAEAGLYVSSAVQAWKPRLVEKDLLLAQRYCQEVLDVSATAGLISRMNFRSGTTFIIGQSTAFMCEMRAVPTFTSNVTAWVATTPTGTQMASFNHNTAAFVAITGALTVGAEAITTKQFTLLLTAATSFDGTAGDICDMRCGSSVLFYMDAEL